MGGEGKVGEVRAGIVVSAVGGWGGMTRIPAGSGCPSVVPGVVFALENVRAEMVGCRRGVAVRRRVVGVGSFRGPRG